MMRAGGTFMVPPSFQSDVNETTVLRTNVLQEIFFLSRQTNQWVGTGYRVLGADNGVGTLYRFSVSTNYYTLTYTNLMSQFVHAPLTNAVTKQLSTNYNRIEDGIIHLRLIAYDTDGRRMGWNTTNLPANYRILRMQGGTRLGLVSSALSTADANVVLRQDFAT